MTVDMEDGDEELSVPSEHLTGSIFTQGMGSILEFFGIFWHPQEIPRVPGLISGPRCLRCWAHITRSNRMTMSWQCYPPHPLPSGNLT